MPEKKKEQKQLNPRVRPMQIGIRTLRKIQIYPLAFGDELEMTDLINQALQAFFMGPQGQGEQEGEFADGDTLVEPAAADMDADFVVFMVNMVRENFKRILELAAADEQDIDALLKDMDNYQVSEAAAIVVEQNFLGDVSKNIQGLLAQVKEAFGWRRPQQPSASGTDTGSTTSTGSPSKAEG